MVVNGAVARLRYHIIARVSLSCKKFAQSLRIRLVWFPQSWVAERCGLLVECRLLGLPPADQYSARTT